MSKATCMNIIERRENFSRLFETLQWLENFSTIENFSLKRR
jgi:hypothetical protein